MAYLKPTQGELREAKQTAVAVANIATPASATAEDCANKINELLNALRTAGIVKA